MGRHRHSRLFFCTFHVRFLDFPRVVGMPPLRIRGPAPVEKAIRLSNFERKFRRERERITLRPTKARRAATRRARIRLFQSMAKKNKPDAPPTAPSPVPTPDPGTPPAQEVGHAEGPD